MATRRLRIALVALVSGLSGVASVALGQDISLTALPDKVFSGRGFVLTGVITSTTDISKYEIQVDSVTWQTLDLGSRRRAETINATVLIPTPGEHTVAVHVFGPQGPVGSGKISVTRIDRPRQMFAIVIGVNEAGPTAPKMKFAEADASDLASALRDIRGSGTEVFLLTGLIATVQALDDALQQLWLKSVPGDSLILYFSGAAGLRKKSDVMQMSPLFSKRNYLWLSGAKPGDSGGNLAVRDLASAVRSIRARRTFLILDTCLDGGEEEAASELDTTARILYGGCMMERERQKGSTFTQNLISLLRAGHKLADVDNWFSTIGGQRVDLGSSTIIRRPALIVPSSEVRGEDHRGEGPAATR